jgi:hypothetical protein
MNELIAIAYLIGVFALGYITRGFSVKTECARSWNEGREYEIDLAKRRRDKRGRYKHRNDINQFTATI